MSGEGGYSSKETASTGKVWRLCFLRLCCFH